MGYREVARIALDLDSVLAATAEPTLEELADDDESYMYADIESWDWGLDKWGGEFLDCFHNQWLDVYCELDEAVPLDELTIQPMEPRETLHKALARLHAAGFRWDIVTGQPNEELITEAKRGWLVANGFQFDDLITVDTFSSKADLADEYDVFIDDNPNLPAELKGSALSITYAQPYNRDVVTDYRAISLNGACEFLLEYYEHDIPHVVEVGAPPTTEVANDVTASTDGGEKLDNDKQLPSGDDLAGRLANDVAELITGTRDTHGDAVENQDHIAEAWTWYLQGLGLLDDDQALNGSDVARMMIQVKLSRAVVGEYDIDHDRDMAGYASISGACAVHRGDATETDIESNE